MSKFTISSTGVTGQHQPDALGTYREDRMHNNRMAYINDAGKYLYWTPPRYFSPPGTGYWAVSPKYTICMIINKNSFICQLQGVDYAY